MTSIHMPPAWLDSQLTRAISGGPGVLPADLDRLHGCLGLVGTLLAEKAQEREADWAEVMTAAAEIETLFRIEDAVAERASGVPARNLRAVLTKLAIWADLSPDGDGDPARLRRDQLVESVRRDITRLAGLGGGPDLAGRPVRKRELCGCVRPLPVEGEGFAKREPLDVAHHEALEPVEGRAIGAGHGDIEALCIGGEIDAAAIPERDPSAMRVEFGGDAVAHVLAELLEILARIGSLHPGARNGHGMS